MGKKGGRFQFRGTLDVREALEYAGAPVTDYGNVDMQFALEAYEALEQGKVVLPRIGARIKRDGKNHIRVYFS